MSTITIESIASCPKKIGEDIRVENLLPEQLRNKAANLISLLQAYYQYLNQAGQPSNAINSLTSERDLDTASGQYLDLIAQEIAAVIPKSVPVDRVRLLKNIKRFYAMRGSEQSISVFFRLLFADEAQVSYPSQSMLIPSDGTWDQNAKQAIYDNAGTVIGYTPGAYTSNKGFLSDSIKIQDSYFYQKFSYVVESGIPISVWQDSFSKLIHPAGFIFFGQILLLAEMLNQFSVPDSDVAGQDAERLPSSMPQAQPGMVLASNYPLEIMAELVDHSATLWVFDEIGVSEFILGETLLVVSGDSGAPGSSGAGHSSGLAPTSSGYGPASGYGPGSGASPVSGILRASALNSYGSGSGAYYVSTLFLTNVTGQFHPGQMLVGQTSGAAKIIRRVAGSQRPSTPVFKEIPITLKLDVPHGTSYSTGLKFLDSATISCLEPGMTVAEAASQYQFGDYTVQDVINSLSSSPLTQNGYILGVTLL